MLEFSKTKIALILILCVAGVFYALPNFLGSHSALPKWLPNKTVNLGLDLRGGSYLLLEADFDFYLKEQYQSLTDQVRSTLREKRIGYRNLTPKAESVVFTLREASDSEGIKAVLREMSREIDIDIENDAITLRYFDDTLKTMRRDVLDQSIEIVRRRVDETGTREPIIQRQGEDRILLQVPGLQDPDALKRLLGRTAKMTFHLMDENEPFPSARRRPAPGTELLTGVKKEQFYMVKRKVEVSGDLLTDARASFNEGQWVVNFKFNHLGGKKFAKITKENVKKPFAVVLDGHVIGSAPVINEPIPGGSGIITGGFTSVEANDLAILLRSGALPAPLHILEERTVGPSLGQDSIDAGKTAALIGVALVIVFMFLFYGIFGVFSNISLVINIVLILALLSVLQATLTLPGIAGIVLTMGMAVDANVLIFERIREEIRIGKTPFAAIDHGFRQAFKTIIDSNITTLIATTLLFIYGSGPVKGFAVTLSIGIVCSMFSAILLTRLMIVLWLKKVRPSTLPI